MKRKVIFPLKFFSMSPDTIHCWFNELSSLENTNEIQYAWQAKIIIIFKTNKFCHIVFYFLVFIYAEDMCSIPGSFGWS